MEILRGNKPFFIILAVVIAISGFFSIQRMGVEHDAKTVDIVLDYLELEKMAKQSKEDTSWWLNEFKKMGITKVGLSEENLTTLTDGDKPIEAELLYEIAQKADWKINYPAEFITKIEAVGYDDYDVLVEAQSKEMYDFVSHAMIERVDKRRYINFETENGGFIFINGTVDDALYKQDEKLINSKGKGFTELRDVAGSRIMFLNLGLAPEKIEILKNAGVDIIPRTAEYQGWNGNKFAKAVVKGYEQLGEVPEYLIFAGQAVLGQDDSVNFISDYLKKNNITVGIVENTNQRENLNPYGIDDVIKNVNYDTVRVFSVWEYIQNRYKYYNYQGAEEIENTLFRAATERNIKLIYYKPIKAAKDTQKYITDVQEYRDLFGGLQERLDEHGITLGSAGVEKPFQIPFMAKAAIAMGCVAAAIIALSGIVAISTKVKWILFAIGAVGVAGAYFVAPNLAELLTSFGASVMIPCVIMIMMFQISIQWANELGPVAKVSVIAKKGAIALTVAVILSLFGAMMTAIPISSINYMLELDIFRGVKAAQLLPLVFFIIVYLSYFGYMRVKETKGQSTLQWSDVKNLINTNIKVWMILISGCILAAGYVYLARTGHESGVEPTNLEMVVRNFLENILYARPRTKEFLVAFPCFMLFVYCVVRKLKLWSFIFGLAAVIGLTSVENTFMHIRTPMELGFIRTGYSLILGLVFGIICVAIFEFLYRIYTKKGNKLNE